MSIRLLHHNEIDPLKWNDLLENTQNGRLFSHFDYLSAVSPEWYGLVEEDEDKYITAFPLPLKKIFGLKYIVQPSMTQQLQILSRQYPLSEDFRKQLNRNLAKYFSVRLSLDRVSADEIQDFRCSERKTMVLSLEKGKNYFESFAKKHQQSIRISRKFDFRIEKNKDFKGIIDGFLRHKADEIGMSTASREAMYRLIPFFETRSDIRVHSAIDPEGNIRAAGLFAGFGNTMTFLLSFSDELGKKNCMMHAIILDWLENDSANFQKLDFEGGNIKSLERFYSRFGAHAEYFSFCARQRFPLNIYFKLIKK